MCKYIFTGGWGGKQLNALFEVIVKNKDKKYEKHRGGIKVRDKN